MISAAPNGSLTTRLRDGIIFNGVQALRLRIQPRKCFMWFFTSPATMLSSVSIASSDDL